MNSTVTTLGVNYLVQTGYLYSISRLKFSRVISYRYYSTSKSDPQSSDLPPVPIFTINNLNNEDCVESSRIILKGKPPDAGGTPAAGGPRSGGGIYSFINTVNGNQYIGSAKDFYLRLNEHFLRSARRKIRSLIWLCKKHLLSMA